MIRGEEVNDEDGQIKCIKVTGGSRMLSKQARNSNKANSTFGGLEESSTDFVLTEADAQVSPGDYRDDDGVEMFSYEPNRFVKNQPETGIFFPILFRVVLCH